ncbi:alkaline phosphatase D family protein [Qipengyuania sp. DGS5-3]|uniref:alkaline phosphatase D family protein n=1 Tax=Qipengyuania sp. DGS5-3 TaxID=3349632 RepID=UPI0036D39C97
MSIAEPPQSAPLPALDRRTLLKSGGLGLGLGASLAASPLAAQMGGQGFTHGIASGEPSQSSVLLWTRFAADQSTTIEWTVSENPDFSAVVSEGSATAHPNSDWCAKSVADDLEPGRWYYYRFIAPDGSASDIGRTRTLPEGPTEQFRMAVFSCSNIGFGWFNAYAHLAEANDVDLVYHAGDYFYEYAPGTYPSVDQALTERLGLDPASETVSLADYRLRFATYRRDRDLQRLHQMYPMISGWDDHESTNDSYATGAQNHQPETEGDWDVRKRAAMRAYREWMPVSDNPWEAYEIGDLATIYRLETRLTSRGKPASFAELLRGSQSPETALASLTDFRDGAYLDPARHMLGTAQEEWLASGMKASRGAGKTWQVLAQQVLMGRVATPVSFADALPENVPDFVRQRVVAGAMASRAGLPLNMDAWDGYPAARGRVFEAALNANANLISLAGDTHNAWAFELAHEGAAVGVEFGGQSVTSPGFENFLGGVDERLVSGALVQENAQLSWANTTKRGYMVVELTPSRATSEYRFLDGVRARGTALSGTQRIASEAGSHKLTLS